MNWGDEMNYWTPCADKRECYYDGEYRGQKTCRILNDVNGGPPYPPEKECPFWKPKDWKEGK